MLTARVISLSFVESQFTGVGLKLNGQKCKQMIFRRSRAFSLPNVDFTEVDSIRILGVVFSRSLSWNTQISDMIKRASICLYVLRRVKCCLCDNFPSICDKFNERA